MRAHIHVDEGLPGSTQEQDYLTALVGRGIEFAVNGMGRNVEGIRGAD